MISSIDYTFNSSVPRTIPFEVTGGIEFGYDVTLDKRIYALGDTARVTFVLTFPAEFPEAKEILWISVLDGDWAKDKCL